MNHIDKWTTINSTIRTEKIAILALQETHLDEDRLTDINRCFNKSFDVINSSDPTNPQGSAGVAFLINKALIAPTNVKTYVLKQGQAIMMRIKWSETEIIILNIYAPNNVREQPAFWAELDLERRAKRLPKPDFLLGDFNITEDPIDRSPPKMNNQAAIEALRETRHDWGIQDQWRHDNPNGRQFIFKQTRDGTYRYARLDRIYSASRHAPNLFEWKARSPTILTDHWLVSVKFVPKDAPQIGKGRWTWPIPTINNEALINKVVSKGIQLQTKMEEAANTPVERRHNDPQILWEEFKIDIQTTAKKELRDMDYKIRKQINLLKEDIDSVINNPEIDENENLRTEIAYLTSELTHLQRKWNETNEKKHELRSHTMAKNPAEYGPQ
ncbi:Endonuclease/exonuclease/phosphatase [Russula aff. rugulosa BPL654]|nr:Endonuclease/exonuclease/phosphatase [Russula aff. rugulosa BPL654]